MAKKKKIDNLLKSKKFKKALEMSLFQIRLSKHIFQARKALGMSQDELAEKAGTTQRIISDIENGNYKMAEMLYRLFRVLDKELISDNENLITGEDSVQSCKIFFVKESEDISLDFRDKPVFDSNNNLKGKTYSFN